MILLNLVTMTARQTNPRRNGGDYRRKSPSLKEKPVILIVCEGKNTEPSYFNQFRLSSAVIKAVGLGNNTLSLVRKTKALANEDSYDQVWCVFDADPEGNNPLQSHYFNEAIRQAESSGFGVAYSNQAFEYWLILHFENHQGGPFRRKDYHLKLNALLKPFGVAWDGTGKKLVSDSLFLLLEGRDAKTGLCRREQAISRARKIYSQLPHSNPAAEESSTTVFRLVEELQQHL